MLERLNNIPRGIDGLKAVGKLSKEDYEQVMTPLLEAARREGRRVRFLYQLGPDFEGFTAGAAWEDAKVGLHYMRLFDACAVVTDLGWIQEATKLVRFMMPCPVRALAIKSATRRLSGFVRCPRALPSPTGFFPMRA